MLRLRHHLKPEFVIFTPWFLYDSNKRTAACGLFLPPVSGLHANLS